MRQWVVIAVLFSALIGVTGCGPGSVTQSTGPAIHMNPSGPGAMKPPGEGGKPSLPDAAKK